MKRTVSAGGVVVNERGEILVVNQNGNSWSLPKGHVESGETPLEAARREILEETGLERVTSVKELGRYERPKLALDGGDDPSELKTLIFFLFRASSSDPLKPSDPKNPLALWADKKKTLELLTHPKDRAFFESIAGEL